MVEDLVVVEIKAVDRLLPLHRAQMLTYLRLTGCPVGLVLNFCAPVLKEVIMRVANEPIDPSYEETEETEPTEGAEKTGDNETQGR
jgi:hypothetical protein